MARESKSKKKNRIILASGSPRRRQLLSPHFNLSLRTPNVDEKPLVGEAALWYVRRVAKQKWFNVASSISDALKVPIIAADTIVVKDGKIYGKPRNKSDAIKTLRVLSGQKHEVITAVVIGFSRSRPIEFIAKSSVKFRQLCDAEIKKYISSGDWRDKAGGYAIQGEACLFVETIQGSMTNIVGLPLTETVKILNRILL